MIYKSIADRLRLRLNSADFAIGSPLPGEKKLAEEFGVARMTIRKAIDLLVDWGLVVRRHGSGRSWRVRTSIMKPAISPAWRKCCASRQRGGESGAGLRGDACSAGHRQPAAD